MIVRAGGLGDPQVEALLVLHRTEALGATPRENAHAMDSSALAAADVTFYSCWDGDTLAGVCALRDFGDATGELKSMRTAPSHLRRGVARRLLDHVVAEARARGWTRLYLETGTAPMFAPANALYQAYGFADGPVFGGYPDSAHNRFMVLALQENRSD